MDQYLNKSFCATDIQTIEAAIGVRLKAVKGQMSVRQFAEILGINAETARRYLLTGRLPAWVAAVVCDRFATNPRWLLSGHGQPDADLEAERHIQSASSEAIAQEFGRRLDQINHTRPAVPDLLTLADNIDSTEHAEHESDTQISLKPHSTFSALRM